MSFKCCHVPLIIVLIHVDVDADEYREHGRRGNLKQLERNVSCTRCETHLKLAYRARDGTNLNGHDSADAHASLFTPTTASITFVSLIEFYHSAAMVHQVT